MNRRNALFGMAKWLMAGFVALLPIKASVDIRKIPRRQEYAMSEMEQAKELAGVLQDAVYENKIRYYTFEFRKLENTIVLCWGD